MSGSFCSFFCGKHEKSHVVIAMIAALSGLLFGYDTGVISGAILFINNQFHLNAQTNGIVVGAVLFGALFGTLFSVKLADYWGRRRLLLVVAGVFIIGTVATTVAHSITGLIVSRIIVGVAIGISSYTAPLYISEIAPVEKRGMLVSFNQLAVTIGILVSYIVDYYFSHTQAWRWMFAVGVVPAFLLLIGMCFLPNSPRWVASKGFDDHALGILKKLRVKVTEEEIQEEYDSIKQAVNQPKANWQSLFCGKMKVTLLIGAGLAVLQQVTGINTILYYAPTIFKMAQFSTSSGAILATMLLGVVFVVSTVIALPLIDSWGRRPLLLLGVFIMMLSLFTLSYVFHFHANQVSHSAILEFGGVASMIVYVFGFAISLGPIMWLMIAEIFPLRIRGFASSIAAATNWGANLIVAITFLSIVEWIGASGAFFLYAIMSAVTLAFIYFIVPETKGISLERIEENLFAGKRARDLGQLEEK